MDQNHEPKRIFTLLLLRHHGHGINQLLREPTSGAADRGSGTPHRKTFGHRLLPGAFPESFGVAGAQGSSSRLHSHPTEMCGARHTSQFSEQIEEGAASYGKSFLVTKAQTAG